MDGAARAGHNAARPRGPAARIYEPERLKFLFVSLARQALRGHQDWPEQWRSPIQSRLTKSSSSARAATPATAYYLAKEHGVQNIAVLEKGWLGGGNTGRNTTVIRSNYLWEASEGIYGHAHRMWPTLSQELNYNLMYSSCGVMMLAHNHHEGAGVQAPHLCQSARLA